MNDLARLPAAERQQLIDEFVDTAFADTDPGAPGAGIAAAMRALPPQLPDEPSTEQVQAWVELAELVADPAFRARVREMAVAGSRGAAPPAVDPASVQEHAGAALAAGLAPVGPAAVAVLDRILPAGLDAAGRAGLADGVATFTDAPVERYWELLAVLNGWPSVPAAVPAFAWLVAALRAQGRPASPGGR